MKLDILGFIDTLKIREDKKWILKRCVEDLEIENEKLKKILKDDKKDKVWRGQKK